MADFDGRVAVVTGGAQGIGGAVATALGEAGASVALWDLDLSLGESHAATLPRAAAFEVDVADYASVEAAHRATVDALGEVDVLVNSAGVAGMNATVADYPVDEFARICAINLLGTFHTNKVVVPAMRARGYGRIVNIASIAGKEGNPNASAYSASKAGVIGFTKSLGKELADVDVAVNCVTPAAARTRIFDQMSEEHIAYMLGKIPRGRFLEVDEAAAMIVWLASPANTFATGAVFDLSGGRATY
ncbi:SDR family NAD(P)-dependent oxidoreductase [Acuticoccus sp.]|uniref:SDR family NAD(P)-dependent oxidoreductase n=1 Tax=Acuticoccus sp. TaxID=1904378 RepID=UPI003B52633A